MLCSRCSPLRFFVNGTVRAQVRSPLCGFPHALLRNFPGEPRAARSVRWVLSQTAPFRCPPKRKKKRKSVSRVMGRAVLRGEA